MPKSRRQLYLTGYQENPQGKMVPVYSTVKPDEPVAGSSLPGARPKSPVKGLATDDEYPTQVDVPDMDYNPRDPSTGAQLRDIYPEDYKDD